MVAYGKRKCNIFSLIIFFGGGGGDMGGRVYRKYHKYQNTLYENKAVFIIFPQLETRFNTHYQNA